MWFKDKLLGKHCGGLPGDHLLIPLRWLLQRHGRLRSWSARGMRPYRWGCLNRLLCSHGIYIRWRWRRRPRRAGSGPRDQESGGAVFALGVFRCTPAATTCTGRSIAANAGQPGSSNSAEARNQHPSTQQAWAHPAAQHAGDHARPPARSVRRRAVPRGPKRCALISSQRGCPAAHQGSQRGPPQAGRQQAEHPTPGPGRTDVGPAGGCSAPPPAPPEGHRPPASSGSSWESRSLARVPTHPQTRARPSGRKDQSAETAAGCRDLPAAGSAAPPPEQIAAREASGRERSITASVAARASLPIGCGDWPPCSAAEATQPASW